MKPEKVFAGLDARIDTYLTRGDPRPVLAPGAVAEAEWLWDATTRDEAVPIEVVHLVAWLHWCRHLAGSADDDRSAALELFAMMVPQHSELLPEPLARAVYGEPTDASPDDLADLGSLVLDQPYGRGVYEAVALLRRAIEGSGPGDPRWAAFHAELCRGLGTYFDEFGDPDDIDAAVEAARVAVAADPCPAYLFNLGRALAARFADRDGLDDLDESVAAFRAGAGAADHGDPDRAELLGSLAIELARRFERLDRPADLDEAIGIARAMGGADWLSQLGAWLQLRFERFNRMADLDEAVEVGRAAAGATPAGDPELPGRLANVAIALRLRFERLGDRADLDEAVRVSRAAVTASPGWRDVARGVMTVIGTAPEAAMTSLSGLCNALRRRYERFGEPADLDEAIDTGRGLLDATPHTDPGRATHSANLALSLGLRFSASRDPADADAAATALRDALAATPPDHTARLTIEMNLVEVLRLRFETVADPADLDEAIATGRARAATIDGDHPVRPRLLVNLGGALLRRHEHSGDDADLDAAVAALRTAAALLPHDDPSRAAALGNLGDALRTVYDTHGDPAALREARALWQAAGHTATAPSAARLSAMRACATAAAETGDWPGAVEASASAVVLLCLGAWRGLSRASREHHLTAGAGTGADAAASAVATGDPRRGVALLEQGRGVLWTATLDARADLAALAARAPELAARLTAVRGALDDAA
ncbi:hypothetical protein [Dactylosporangium sp. CA-139066]|uniref:hypothetical protein n=1 Tax=Dactylosporangium sp. CA-139066 TaxID=3239930 RepID=UPI003D8FE79B